MYAFGDKRFFKHSPELLVHRKFRGYPLLLLKNFLALMGNLP